MDGVGDERKDDKGDRATRRREASGEGELVGLAVDDC